MNEINQNIIEKRKILILKRNNEIKNIEKLYKKKYKKISVKKSLFITESIEIPKTSKNIINSLNNRQLNLSKESKKAKNTPISIRKSLINDNIEKNEKKNENKLNDSMLNNRTKIIFNRKSALLPSNSMEDRINKKVLSRNSHGIDEDNNLSSKLFNTFRKEFRSQYGNYILNSSPINDNNKKNKIIYSKKKNTNPLEIQEEDLIFDELNKIKPKRKKHIHSSSINKKNKNLSINKTKLSTYINLSPEKKKLNKVYNFSPDFFEKINKIRKQRNKYNLKTYQTHLLNAINNNLSKEKYKQLEKKFNNIRNYSYQKIILNRKFLEKMEKKEEIIIKRINSENKKCVTMMKTFSNDFNFKSFYLPKVRFHKVIKSENPHYFHNLSLDNI